MIKEGKMVFKKEKNYPLPHLTKKERKKHGGGGGVATTTTTTKAQK